MRQGRFGPGTGLLALLVAGLAIINLGVLRGSSSVSNYFELKKSRDVLSQTVESLKKENNDLQSEIMQLKNCPSCAAKMLRDKYHVTDPDEYIVFFPD